MDQSWAVVVAALGASAFTILGTYGIDALRAKRAGRTAKEERRQVVDRTPLIGPPATRAWVGWSASTGLRTRPA
jgi:hypothetical protein